MATIQSPLLCPLACHPYTKQETNMHIGMWAQTKVRLSLIHIQPGRLSSNRPLHPPPSPHVFLPFPYSILNGGEPEFIQITHAHIHNSAAAVAALAQHYYSEI